MPENFYHVSLKLGGQRCLVVGGGAVAERKVKSLLECRAKVTVVSPELVQGLSERVAKGELLHKNRGFEPHDLDGMLLVIAATDDEELNARVAELCRKRGIPVNVVDNPELSTFFVPASLRRGPICISVSTGGASPLMARRIREYLESQLGPELGELAVILGALREQMKKRFPEQEQRQREWEKLLPEKVIEQLDEKKLKSFRKLVEECILWQSE
ncbi:MAG TPA: bifunctional precorrin-2 dehydrogenase/sirohydrochlorin ferrochelatase [Syntrophomonadaceae bacterium]|nr:bifunctional precorrin-2 dehydrogenase/sirohydrochlorin ferrochelatase [Syntrophomonadaceae bacterium]